MTPVGSSTVLPDHCIDNGFYTKLQSEYGAIKGFTPPS